MNGKFYNFFGIRVKIILLISERFVNSKQQPSYATHLWRETIKFQMMISQQVSVSQNY